MRYKTGPIKQEAPAFNNNKKQRTIDGREIVDEIYGGKQEMRVNDVSRKEKAYK